MSNFPKIVIETDADFTPVGKRSVKIISIAPRQGRYAVAKGTRVIRWYVGGAIYATLPITSANIKMTEQWFAA